MANSTEIWSDEEIWSDDECQSNECDSADTSKLLCSNCTLSFCLCSRLFSDSDTAINELFFFFDLFFGTFARTVPAIPWSFISKLPTTKHAASFYKASGGTFIQFVCCPSCHSLYQWKECIIHFPDNQLVSKRCSFQRFPNHPQHQHRHACGQSLMKIISSKGKQSLYPRLIYCYKSVIESLQEMVSKPGFIDKCELWSEKHRKGCTQIFIYYGLCF